MVEQLQEVADAKNQVKEAKRETEDAKKEAQRQAEEAQRQAETNKTLSRRILELEALVSSKGQSSHSDIQETT